MITTILFDLDDTLLDFKRAEANALRQTLLQMDIAPTEQTLIRYSAINQHQWELLEQGRITREQVLHQRFDILFQELKICRSNHLAQEIYEHLLSLQHDLIPGAIDLLERLYGTYTLYLVSNGTAKVQDQRLQDTGLDRYFQNIFISQRIGADKPSPVFFDRCFAAISDQDRNHAMIVGDSLSSDILGGIHAGIQTCWFNPHRKQSGSDISPDYEIHTLSQLPELLETLQKNDKAYSV